MPKRIIRMKDYFDKWSLIIILTTFVLFIAALFVKGLTKDLLLEVGIFLISVKLIMSAYKNSVYAKKLNKDLEEIKNLIKEQNNSQNI